MHVKTEYQAIVMFSRGGPKKKNTELWRNTKLRTEESQNQEQVKNKRLRVLSLFINFLRNILQTLSLFLSLSLSLSIYIYIYIYMQVGSDGELASESS
jgi:hypothetical protein